MTHIRNGFLGQSVITLFYAFIFLTQVHVHHYQLSIMSMKILNLPCTRYADKFRPTMCVLLASKNLMFSSVNHLRKGLLNVTSARVQNRIRKLEVKLQIFQDQLICLSSRRVVPASGHLSMVKNQYRREVKCGPCVNTSS